MAHDPLQLDADVAALHRYLGEADNAIAEARGMTRRLSHHLEELLEDNRRLTAERDLLRDQLQRQPT